MPRPQPALLAALATAALLLPASGCYRYDARANNLTGHEVRVSIHKGTRKREVSTALLGAGGSAGWTGSFNGPVVMRVESEGMTVDVPLPRRAHTEVEIAGGTGAWSLIKTVGDESYSIDPWSISMADECGEDCEGECCADAADASATEEAADEPETIDLVDD
jgi:hypothetical protein